MSKPPTNIWHRKFPSRVGNLIVFIAASVFSYVSLIYLGANPGGMKSGLGQAIYTILPAAIIGGVTLLLYLLVRWLCVWRNLRRVLFVSACTLTVIAVVLTEENWRGHRAWENHRRALEAKGEKFVVAQLAPPPVPDDQNFALTPLLKPILDFNYPGGMRPTGDNHQTSLWRDTNGYARLQNIIPDQKMPGSTNEPGLGNPIKGTFTDLAAWQDLYRGNTNYPQPATPGTPAADILVALRKFDTDIAELRQAAASRPYARFPLPYDVEPAASILLPHLSPVKALSHLFNLRATAELDLGRTDEAFADLKMGLRFSDSLKDEPTLISHMVRLASLTFSLQTIREGLVRHAWTDAQLAELDHYLASLNLLAEWKHSMHGERAFAVDTFDYMRRTGSVDPNEYRENPGPARKAIGVIFSAFFYQNLLALSEMEGNYLEHSVDENARRVFPEVNARLEAEVKVIHDHPLRHLYSISIVMLMPALTQVSTRNAQGQSRVDEARLAIALERYHRANGHYPDALDPLTPKFIDKIPTDIMDGQPLRYHKTDDDKFILYSIGWNLKDDGGVIGRKAGDDKEHPLRRAGIDTLSGDWVWFSSTNDFKLD